MPDSEYFAYDALNASTLKKYMKTPARAHIEKAKKDTSYFDLGHLVHSIILEPETVSKTYIRMPSDQVNYGALLPEEHFQKVPDMFLTKSGTIAKKNEEAYLIWLNDMTANNISTYIKPTEAKKLWLAYQEAKGLTVLKREDYREGLAIAKKALRHERLNAYLRHPLSKPEMAFIANLKLLDGQLCKGKTDDLIMGLTRSGAEINILNDLKTIGRNTHIQYNPLNFDPKVSAEQNLKYLFQDLGYDMSLAMYRELFKTVTGKNLNKVMITAMQTDSIPFESLCIHIDEEWLDFGAHRLRMLYLLYKQCLKENFRPEIDQFAWDEENECFKFIPERQELIIGLSEKERNKRAEQLYKIRQKMEVV